MIDEDDDDCKPVLDEETCRFFHEHIAELFISRFAMKQAKQEPQDEPLLASEIKTEHLEVIESNLDIKDDSVLVAKDSSQDRDCSIEFENATQMLDSNLDEIETTMRYVQEENRRAISIFLGEIKIETDTSDCNSVSWNLNVDEDDVVSICNLDSGNPAEHPSEESCPTEEELQNISIDLATYNRKRNWYKRKIQNEHIIQENWSDTAFSILHDHDKELYICNGCNFVTRDRTVLNRHLLFSIIFGCEALSAGKRNLRSTQNNRSYNVQCEQCRYLTKTKEQLIEHFKTYHNREIENRYGIISGEGSSLAGTSQSDRELPKLPGAKSKKRSKRKINGDRSRQDNRFKNDSRYDNSKLYKCNQCNFKTRNKMTLNRHLVFSTVFSCQVAPENRQNTRTTTNILTEGNGETFQCEQCGYTATIKKNLIEHFEIKHTRKDDKQSYKDRNEIIVSNEQYMLEKSQDVLKPKCQNRSKHNRKVQSEVSFSGSKQADKMQVYRCQQCNFKTSSRLSLNRHLIFSIIYNCKQSPENKQDLNTSSNLSRGAFQCEQCRYTTTIKQQLIEHFEKEHNRKSYGNGLLKCKRCNFQARDKVALNRHLVSSIIFGCKDSPKNRQNSNSETFHCERCTYISNTKQQLIDHFNNQHHIKSDKNKLLKCKCCSFETRNRDTLRRHYVFSNCDDKLEKEQKLNTASSLLRDNRNEEYQCDKCGYTTKIKKQLIGHFKTQHIRTSTKHYCADGYRTLDNNEEYQIRDSSRRSDDLRVQNNNSRKVQSGHVEQSDSSKVGYDNTKESYQCHRCHFRTTDKSTFNRHLISSIVVNCDVPPGVLRDNKVESLRCEQCRYTAEKKEQLVKHIKVKHDRVVNRHENITGNYTRIKQKTDKKHHTCKQCDFSTKLKRDLIKHTKSHNSRIRISKSKQNQYRCKDKKCTILHKEYTDAKHPVFSEHNYSYTFGNIKIA